jgi:hypothetical protein
MQTCERRKQELDFFTGKLFEYYQKQNDYENAKNYLLKNFECKQSRELDKEYTKIKDYLNEADWLAVENKLFEALKKRNLSGYMGVCLSKGLKQEVYDIITKKTPGLQYWDIDYDFFADKLKKDFPEKIIEYYFALSDSHIELGAGKDRRNYVQAVYYLKKVKEIYLKILKDKPLWESRLAQLKEQNQKRKAFIEEAKVLE